MTMKRISIVAAGALLACGVTACKDETAKPAAPEAVTAKAAPADPGQTPMPANPPVPTTEPAPNAPASVKAATMPAPGAATDQAPAAASPEGPRASAGGVSWAMPAGWKQGGDKPMRLATVTDGTAEIAVTAFPGDVGGILMNVNRWRGQVGLPEVASVEEAEKLMTEIDVSGRKIRTVDFEGRDRILVAIVPADGRQYFFRLTGPKDVVAPRKAAFDALVRTIRVE